MEYKEIKRTEEKITQTTVTTTVEFTFEVNGEKLTETIDIPHFNPKDETDIELGIKNKYESRLRELTEKTEK